MAASLDGLDAIAFMGGVGERSAGSVAATADGCAVSWAVALDARANDAATGDGEADIGTPGAPARTFVIPAREDVVIARSVRETLFDS